MKKKIVKKKTLHAAPQNRGVFLVKIAMRPEGLNFWCGVQESTTEVVCQKWEKSNNINLSKYFIYIEYCLEVITYRSHLLKTSIFSIYPLFLHV